MSIENIKGVLYAMNIGGVPLGATLWHHPSTIQVTHGDVVELISTIEAQQKRIAGLEEALKPFVNIRDAVPPSQSSKLINKNIDGLAPVNLTVTKEQFLSARRALHPGVSP